MKVNKWTNSIWLLHEYKTNSFIFLLKLECIPGDLLCVINTEGIMALVKLTLILLCKRGPDEWWEKVGLYKGQQRGIETRGPQERQFPKAHFNLEPITRLFESPKGYLEHFERLFQLHNGSLRDLLSQRNLLNLLWVH